jgi:hypothetical protein
MKGEKKEAPAKTVPILKGTHDTAVLAGAVKEYHFNHRINGRTALTEIDFKSLSHYDYSNPLSGKLYCDPQPIDLFH